MSEPIMLTENQLRTIVAAILATAANPGHAMKHFKGFQLALAEEGKKDNSPASVRYNPLHDPADSSQSLPSSTGKVL